MTRKKKAFFNNKENIKNSISS